MEKVVHMGFQLGVCAICRKKRVERWCDYIVKYHHSLITLRDYNAFKEANQRGVQYDTCDLPMCEDCAMEQGGDTHLCPHHHSLQLQARIPDDYQRMRQQREQTRIAEEIIKGK